MTATAVRNLICRVCGDPFTHPRGKAGRPPVFCSETCRVSAGKHGELRLDRASSGTGFLAPNRNKHNGISAITLTLAEEFGGDLDAGFPGHFVNDDDFKDASRRALQKSRRAARPGISVEDEYDLPGAPSEGATCPHVGPVIGQDLPWFWQEQYSS